MTQTSQSEAESAEAYIAADGTRALWRDYQAVSQEILARTDGSIPTEPGPSVGRVVRLLREQKIILDELLGGSH